MKGRKQMKKFMVFCLTILLSIGILTTQSKADNDISARAAVAIELKTDRILFAKNPNYKQPPASTTKLVTAMVVLDRLPLDKVVKVSENASSTPTVSPRIRANEHYTVNDLLYMTLMRSINSAAVALAEAVAGSEEEFVRLMNEKAQQIDAENTRFANASGLPGGEQYITAYDLARIMKESLKYPQIREIINTRAKHLTSYEGRKIFLKNTNQLLWDDDGIVIGGKTGYTKAARHCFVSAGQKGDSMIVVALLGESVRDNLWNDTNFLLNRGYDVLEGKAEPMVYFATINENPTMTTPSYQKVAYKKTSGNKEITKKKTHKTKQVAKNTKKQKVKTKSKSLKQTYTKNDSFMSKNIQKTS
ncbi:MAG: D-alanyl-D-alanine carboxypeptidase [Thermodesulfovibrionales bacterium]|nr:D-alanyl-D-alanine carboxypeptidase [Thermodesulfovibrionales bacterium]